MSLVERLSDSWIKCMYYTFLRDQYYDRFLKANRLYLYQFREANQELDYELSNHWQICLVLEKARWSTLFSAFQRQIRR